MSALAETRQPLPSQEWSCSYAFDEIELDFGGVLVPSFSGTATLAEDGDEFYVKAICLEGGRKLVPGSRFGKPAVVWLTHPGVIPTTFEGQLFHRIAVTIETSTDAAEHFTQERAS